MALVWCIIHGVFPLNYLKRLNMKENVSRISQLSLSFISKSRVTSIILLAILVLGAFSYTTFLKREGFPSVEVPIVLIQAPYFTGDAQKVDQEVTRPLERAIGDLSEVSTINSTTNENISFIVAQLESTIDSETGRDLIKDKINEEVELPESVEVVYEVFDAGTLDGAHELIFTISGNKSTENLQEKASKVALKVEENPRIKEANVIEVITQQVNPETGEEFDFQGRYNRVGIKDEAGNLVFNQAISIGVNAKGEAGTLDLSEALRSEIEELKEEGQLNGYDISYGGDFADGLRLQIETLESNAVSGLIAVVIILFLFVNWRASLVTSIFIPTVLSATFVVLFALGYSLNVISLFSLILVLGLFVDDAIVIVEAIVYQKQNGKRSLDAVTRAINDVGQADIMGTLTTILVFAPVLFASGVLGDFIRLIPVTVIVSLTLSLLVALTIMPFLANMIIRSSKEEVKKKEGLAYVIDRLLYGFGDIIIWISQKVSEFVNWYLSNNWRIAGIFVATILIIIGSFRVASNIKFNIFPAAKDTDQLQLTISNEDPDSTIEIMEDISKDVEGIVANNIGEYINTYNYFEGTKSSAFIQLNLTPINDRDFTSREMVDLVNSELEDYTKARVKIDQIGAGPPTEDFQFAMQILEDDQEVAKRLAEDIKSFLEDVELEGGNGVDEVLIARTETISKIDGERYIELKAKLSEAENTGLTIETREKVEEEFDEQKLEEYGVTTDSLGFDFGQESENLESFQSLVFTGILAIILIYVLLVWQFDSFLQPVLILFAIPLSFPGLFGGLVLTDNPFSFFAMLGVIGLIGIVVNNTIMLVDFANQAALQGKSIKDSVVQAIGIRFRPLITTSFTTVAGLLPLALTDPFWEALAFTIVFGLLSSTIMVILVFPAFFVVIEKIRELKRRAIARFVEKE